MLQYEEKIVHQQPVGNSDYVTVLDVPIDVPFTVPDDFINSLDEGNITFVDNQVQDFSDFNYNMDDKGEEYVKDPTVNAEVDNNYVQCVKMDNSAGCGKDVAEQINYIDKDIPGNVEENSDSSFSFHNIEKDAVPSQRVEVEKTFDKTVATEEVAEPLEIEVEKTSSKTVVKSKRPLSSDSRKEAKLKRLRFENYLGYRRLASGQIQQTIEREQRTMGERCNHEAPKKRTSRSLLCSLITDLDRDTLYKYFKDLESWEARKTYIKGLVVTRGPLRRRKNKQFPNRKSQSHDCYLPQKTGEKFLVCRTMFINTFAIGRDTFQRWSQNFDLVEKGLVEQDDNETDRETDKVNKATDTTLKNKQNARKWLNNLPKVPSHYCRSSSKKNYIESLFRSTLHLFQVYEEFCKQHNQKPISRTLFRKLLKEENIAIHQPRKDQCDFCCMRKLGNLSEDIYNDHIIKKNEAHKAKLEAKESANDKKLVITMDLQSVLLAPKLEASAVYYKQKLQIHNFTVYSLNNADVDLYVWHECNGGVTSNEFTSCIVDFIKKQAEAKFEHIVCISDGCGYQNRNKTLSSALISLAKSHNITIEQLILERGHTMMEADAVHSSLEAHFKPPIFAPSDYVSRMRQARKHHPYNIHVLDYTFFDNYEKTLPEVLLSIKPSRNSKVTDLRALLYLPSGEIQFKLRHSDEWRTLEVRRITQSAALKKLYRYPLKLKKQKYEHLQELKTVIEKDFHPFYDSLPHM